MHVQVQAQGDAGKCRARSYILELQAGLGVRGLGDMDK